MQDKANFKWADTRLKGILKVVTTNEINGVPIVKLRMYSDLIQNSLVFEYELPINFSFDPNFHETMAAIQLKQAYFIGFIF